MRYFGFFTLFFTLFWLQGKSQQQFNWLSDSSKIKASLGFQNQIQSNFLRTSFIYSTLFGETVDYAVSQKMSEKAKNFNRFGLVGNQSFNFRYRIKPNNFITLHIADRSLIYGQLSSDLLKLASGGNKQFAGLEAKFNSSYLNLLRFQEIGLGFQFQVDNILACFNANYLNAENLLQANASGGGLYTSPFGDEVEILFKGQYAQSDTANQKVYKNNGHGFNVGFRLESEVKLFGFFQSGLMSVSVQDFGMLQWSKSTAQMSINQKFNFKGIHIENLLAYSPAEFESQHPKHWVDSLSKNLNYKTYNTWLPTLVRVDFYQIINANQSSYFGLQYRITSSFYPLFYYTHQTQVNKWLSLLPGFTVGGFGDYNLGFSVKAKYNQFNFQAGSYTLDALIFPKYRNGAGFMFTLNYQLP